MTKLMRGVVHGRTIVLDQELGIADGQQVGIIVKTLTGPALERWGEGLRRCAGAFAAEWTEEDDRIMDEIYRERKRDPRPEAS
jgi:hypothetical protein